MGNRFCYPLLSVFVMDYKTLLSAQPNACDPRVTPCESPGSAACTSTLPRQPPTHMHEHETFPSLLAGECLGLLGLFSNRVTGTPWNSAARFVKEMYVRHSAIPHFALRHHMVRVT